MVKARTRPRVKGNRLVEVQRSAAGDPPLTRRGSHGEPVCAANAGRRPLRRVKGTTTVATYAYDGKNRRVSKVITNNGVSETDNDGGNTTIHFHYCGVGGTGGVGSIGVSPVGWNICETRDGSNQATRQWVWGTRYTDEILFMDVNGDPTEGNDCDPDAQGGESTYDRRYFYHQDRQPLTQRSPLRGGDRAAIGELRSHRCVKGNWNVVALSEYGDGVGTDARLIERYAYTPYGQFIVLKGDSGSGELANALHVSSVGNPFTHQGLGFDHEKSSYQNRWREYMAAWERFNRTDPMFDTMFLEGFLPEITRPREKAEVLGRAVSLLSVDLRLYESAGPTVHVDPQGLCHCCDYYDWGSYHESSCSAPGKKGPCDTPYDHETTYGTCLGGGWLSCCLGGTLKGCHEHWRCLSDWEGGLEWTRTATDCDD